MGIYPQNIYLFQLNDSIKWTPAMFLAWIIVLEVTHKRRAVTASWPLMCQIQYLYRVRHLSQVLKLFVLVNKAKLYGDPIFLFLNVAYKDWPSKEPCKEGCQVWNGNKYFWNRYQFKMAFWRANFTSQTQPHCTNRDCSGVYRNNQNLYIPGPEIN